jgi:outer membrane protein assembly factor BamA
MTYCSYLKYVLFAGFVTLSANLCGQKVYSVVKTDQPIKLKSKFKNAEDAEKYMAEKVVRLRKDGFSEANIDSTNLKNDSLFFYLHIGEKYFWESLSFDSIPTEVTSLLRSKTSKINNTKFDAELPHKIGDDILTFYENSGYPFSKIKYDSIFIDSNKVKMKISLSKGPLIKIDSISIKGDLKINPHYIYRVTGIKPGDLYNEKKIKNIPYSIQSVPFIQQFRNQQLYFTTNLNILFIYLNPRKTNVFTGILGFQNDPRTNKLMLTGDLALNLNNVFKQGEWIRFNWNRFQSLSQKLDFNIGFPFIFKSPVGVEGSIDLFKQDSTFLDVQFEGGLLFNFAMNSRATFSIASRESNTTSTSVANIEDISIINYSLRIDYSGFDYIFNPSKGFGGFGKLSLGNVGTTDTTEGQPVPDKIQYQGVVNVKYFIPIFRKQSIGLIFKGGIIVNNVI